MQPIFGLYCGVLMASSIIVTLLLLRIRPTRGISSRVPMFLELPLVLFLGALALLPGAIPSVFQRVLGHSIDYPYRYPVQANGVQITESWILARWLTPISHALFAVATVGMLWSLFN